MSIEVFLFTPYSHSILYLEYDNEIQGGQNSYTTQFRQYDPRLGRWKSLDPLMMMFPNLSPYVGFDNNPIYYVDPYGLASEGGPGDREINCGINEGGGSKDAAGSRAEVGGRQVVFADVREDKNGNAVNPKYSNAYRIAKNNDLSLEELYEYNPGLEENKNFIGQGQMINISAPVKESESNRNSLKYKRYYPENNVYTPIMDNLTPDKYMTPDMKVESANDFERWLLNNIDQDEVNELAGAFGNSTASQSSTMVKVEELEYDGVMIANWSVPGYTNSEGTFVRPIKLQLRRYDSQGVERMVFFVITQYVDSNGVYSTNEGRLVEMDDTSDDSEYFQEEFLMLKVEYNLFKK